MEAEASPFESSEQAASLLASTPLLSESWRLCSVAAPSGFVSERIGDVGYFAFSACCSIQTITRDDSGYYSTYRNLVPLDSAGAGAGDGDRPFAVLTKGEEEKGAVMVHAGLLHLFLSLRSSQAFQDQMLALIKGSKSIVITGHSIGGTTASLCALWLLCYLQSISSTLPVLCITFGSPLIGNESLSRAILRERWGGNFCHVVSRYDIMPRLLFAPLESCTRQLHFLLHYYWQMSMLLASSPSNFAQLIPVLQLSEEEKAKLLSFVSHYNLLVSSVAQAEAREEKPNSLYWPFGNYMFCSQEGAICVENAASVIKMMHLMFATANPSCCIDDHLKYGQYVGMISAQFMKKKSFLQREVIPESSYEAGVALALQSSGISQQEPAAGAAVDCLMMARKMRRTPSLNCANLAVKLSKVVPYRAQIEWYMASCDKSNEQLGYYDSFKQRGSSKKDHKINMNRILLAGFWNEVLRMLENNELPYDFNKRGKWVNGSQFYKLLVEPLDIAEYYRSGMHRIKGHYLKHGRERRFEVFDRWWREREVDPEENTSVRSKFAGLTQDSCFWARVEEARDWLANVRSESDVRKLHLLWESINSFEVYATRLVDSKEVSKDVLAKNSSYSLWVEELRGLKSQMQQIRPLDVPRFRDAELFP